MNNLLNNQYYNLTEWKIRKFCGKYKITYGRDIGLQNVRRCTSLKGSGLWLLSICISRFSNFFQALPDYCKIIAITYCLKYLQYHMSQILAIPIVCWVREKSAATPDTSGRSRPISAYFASESSLALGKWQNFESNEKRPRSRLCILDLRAKRLLKWFEQAQKARVVRKWEK